MSTKRTSKGNDPRALANHVLDWCETVGISITNLKLQKLMYFAHGLHIVRTGDPLIYPGFQAWRFGPVNKLTYNCFKKFGDEIIDGRAEKQIAESGETIVCVAKFSHTERQSIEDSLNLYARASTGQLVNFSHIENGPWHVIWELSKSKVSLGLKIPDEVIQSRFFPTHAN